MFIIDLVCVSVRAVISVCLYYLFLLNVRTKLYPSRQIVVPRTSRGRPPSSSPGRPLKVLCDYPGDVPNWRPGEVPIWRPGDISKWRPGDVLIWRLWEVVSGCPQDVLRTSPRRPWKHIIGTIWGHRWMFLNFFLFFFFGTFLIDQIYLKAIHWSFSCI